MQSFEYTVARIPMKGILRRNVSSDLESVLDAAGKEGWMLVNSIAPSSGLGESDQVILIFLRETD